MFRRCARIRRFAFNIRVVYWIKKAPGVSAEKVRFPPRECVASPDQRKLRASARRRFAFHLESVASRIRKLRASARRRFAFHRECPVADQNAPGVSPEMLRASARRRFAFLRECPVADQKAPGVSPEKVRGLLALCTRSKVSYHRLTPSGFSVCLHFALGRK